jgi:hypothetical protein
MRSGHRNRWTPEEDDLLREMIIANASVTLISAKLKRSARAIRMRIIALGRLSDSRRLEAKGK